MVSANGGFTCLSHLGFYYEYPINSWMVARGLKHGMMSAISKSHGMLYYYKVHIIPQKTIVEVIQHHLFGLTIINKKNIINKIFFTIYN